MVNTSCVKDYVVGKDFFVIIVRDACVVFLTEVQSLGGCQA